MATHYQGLLIDSDTLYKWVFKADDPESIPIVGFEDIDLNCVKYAPFTAIPDLHEVLRFLRENMYDASGSHEAESFSAQMEASLHRLFYERVSVRYASEKMCKRWCELASSAAVHDSAHRDHAWMVVCAQELRDSHCDVTIASENPEIYLRYKEHGLLDDIEVLTRS